MAAPDPVEELERSLGELARQWERFFAGDRQVSIPPERQLAALDRRLREVSRSEPPTASEKFRMDQLLHRFAALSQLWQRQLRQREEASAAAAQRVLNARSPQPVSEMGEEYRTVFAQYLEALERTGHGVAVEYARFRDTLEQQRRQLEGRGATVEDFEVVTEGGRVRVRARVRRGRSA